MKEWAISKKNNDKIYYLSWPISTTENNNEKGTVKYFDLIKIYN